MGDEMTSLAVIIGSAPCESWDNLKRYSLEGAYVIAADGGRLRAEQAGVPVHWYVGDGDSGGFAAGLPSEVLPVEKDVTDMEAAVHHALEQNRRTILMWGASGGRADHHLANLQLLEQIPNAPRYKYLGIIPLDAQLTGVSIEGVKYPLTCETVLRGSTRTVSNEILDGCDAEVTIGTGSALLVRSGPILSDGETKEIELF